MRWSREDEDMVSWTSLIAGLHDCQQLQLLKGSASMHSLQSFGVVHSGIMLFFPNDDEKGGMLRVRSAIVHARLKTRSWDLMPPDVVRPLASSTLGTLVSIAYRMGMIWVSFAPSEGKIRAEGLGQSFSATIMQGLSSLSTFLLTMLIR
jgi:hypothetical protein